MTELVVRAMVSSNKYEEQQEVKNTAETEL